MKRGTTAFLKVAIIVMAISVLAICIWLPWLAKSTAEMNPEYAYLRFPVLIGMYITAVPFYLALYEAYKILSFIERDHAFSERTVVSLRNIRNSAVTISILYGIGVVFLETLHISRN